MSPQIPTLRPLCPVPPPLTALPAKGEAAHLVLKGEKLISVSGHLPSAWVEEGLEGRQRICADPPCTKKQISQVQALLGQCCGEGFLKPACVK